MRGPRFDVLHRLGPVEHEEHVGTQPGLDAGARGMLHNVARRLEGVWQLLKELFYSVERR